MRLLTSGKGIITTPRSHPARDADAMLPELMMRESTTSTVRRKSMLA
jgi:hypothetical protein